MTNLREFSSMTTWEIVTKIQARMRYDYMAGLRGPDRDCISGALLAKVLFNCFLRGDAGGSAWGISHFFIESGMNREREQITNLVKFLDSNEHYRDHLKSSLEALEFLTEDAKYAAALLLRILEVCSIRETQEWKENKVSYLMGVLRTFIIAYKGKLLEP